MTRFPPWLRTRTAAILHDLMVIPAAWMGAWWLNFNFDPLPAPVWHLALGALPVLLLVQGPVLVYFGLYRGVWRFASLPDLSRIVKAVVVGVALSTALLFLISHAQGVPHAVFPLYGMILVMGLGAPRLLYRWTKDCGAYRGTGKRVLIVGAGTAGEMLARDLLRAREREYRPVAFVDDNPAKQSAEIHGIRVMGRCADISEVVAGSAIELILIAVPSANTGQMRRIVEICEETGVEFRTLPRVRDLVAGRQVFDALREVSIEDLLGRDPVNLNWKDIRRGISEKVVLVTGGGGSIGAELCRQIAGLKPRALVILDNNEYALYRVERELSSTVPELALHAVLGDVTDVAAVDHVLGLYRPQLVFHAAAYKHVPMLERQIREAVRNNVLGTRIMAEAVHRHGVPVFVLISTDKAVNPVNVLGATKRVAELVCDAYQGCSSSHFITVRFGNVLGSTGSVVPLFRQQIRNGGPVTVTHPEVTRYFMTVGEASQLILQAAAMGRGGEVFVLDMGEPVKIRYLAEQMIRLAGKQPGEDIGIVYTDLRPGEKLSEELFYAEEHLDGTAHHQILLASARENGRQNLNAALDELAKACAAFDDATLCRLLHQLVPSFGAKAVVRAEQGNVIPFKSSSC